MYSTRVRQNLLSGGPEENRTTRRKRSVLCIRVRTSKPVRYRCPVCMFDALPYPPADYHVCPCCGTEFGNDDEDFSHSQLREMWLATGAHWFFGTPPPGWNWLTQLYNAGLIQMTMTGVEAIVELESVSVPGPILHPTNRFQYSLVACS